MTITPNPAVSGVGLRLALKATGTYSDGTTADVTTSGAWVCGSPAVVAVQPTTGVSTGVSLGTGTVRLAIGSVAATASVAMVRNTWTPGGEASRVTDNATVHADDRVLTVGDWEYQSTLIYDPLSRTFSPVANYVVASAVFQEGSPCWPAAWSWARAASARTSVSIHPAPASSLTPHPDAGLLLAA